MAQVLRRWYGATEEPAMTVSEAVRNATLAYVANATAASQQYGFGYHNGFGWLNLRAWAPSVRILASMKEDWGTNRGICHASMCGQCLGGRTNGATLKFGLILRLLTSPCK